MYNGANSVYEYKNQKNKENIENAMSSNSRVPEEKAKMSTSYAAAEREYKNGNIKEGDRLCSEGKNAAEQAKKEIRNDAGKKSSEYMKKYEEEYKNGNKEKANEYLKKADDTWSEAKNKEKAIDEEKTKAEEQAKAHREEGMSKSR